MKRLVWLAAGLQLILGCSPSPSSDQSTATAQTTATAEPRSRVALDKGWRFYKYPTAEQADTLIYDERPPLLDDEDGKAADAQPTEAVELTRNQAVLKAWVLPTANAFIANPAQQHQRPAGSPGSDFPFVQSNFDDSQWQQVRLPHDWAIAGPFLAGDDAAVGGGMGRLPSPGVAWYRNKFSLNEQDKQQRIYLEIDGAMSYAMVWLNGQLVGGWPYGYASFELDLTPYVRFDQPNQLAIRLDNPAASSRWYPGGGLYRDVWLSKRPQLHFSQWGTLVQSSDISKTSARLSLQSTVQNHQNHPAELTLKSSLHLWQQGQPLGAALAQWPDRTQQVPAGGNTQLHSELTLANPKLWGPLPQQQPNLYVAVTELWQNGQLIDRQQQRFGIRQVQLVADQGLLVNGEKIYLQGVNQHHDLGALGAAFNRRAAERQLQLLREMGVNAIRLAHNPAAPELLELTDEMGFLVVNEIFDVWQRKKTPHDFHLIFDDWSEADLRAFIRRDRQHPSVIMWSLGNEVGEQYTGEAGAAVAQRLHDIAKQEDPTRPTAASFNYAKPDMPITAVMDSISLNYQGEGIRNAPAYQHLQGIRTEPLYPAFAKAFPDKLIFSSENAAAVSSRGEYQFPLTPHDSAPVADGAGGDPASLQVSSYELYTAPFGSSADKVLRSLAAHPEVAGGFVWSGWDYLGEPTPYYAARSSYFGVIDLAGFKKDRFYLYQAAWRPELPMVHLLPHWNWPGREGEITPVHAFTSGDEAELFVNGQSQGRLKKQPGQYRLRWDKVRYQPGEVTVIAYKNGAKWAEQRIETTGAPSQLQLEADRTTLSADGRDLSFITIKLLDAQGRVVPTAKQAFEVHISGPAELAATDNGDPADLTSFASAKRHSFNGLGLAIVRSSQQKGEIKVRVTAEGLVAAEIGLSSR